MKRLIMIIVHVKVGEWATELNQVKTDCVASIFLWSFCENQQLFILCLLRKISYMKKYAHTHKHCVQ